MTSINNVANDMNTGGVITGDIVNSSALSDAEHQACLQQVEQAIAIFQDEFHAQGDVFRGDEFQVFVPNPKDALRCAVLLRLALMKCVKGADARVSVGIGKYKQIETELRKTAKGEAFQLSGRALKDMDEERLKLSLQDTVEANPSRDLLIRHLDFMMTGLSEKQAEVLFPRLLYPELTQDALSAKTGIHRRSLASRLQRANASLILDTLDALETTLIRSMS
ncbi:MULTISPECIES: SatD family protein [Marinomonas]|uniref:SatD family protein n=1 Tax=Marinomonas rhodophyticola TaxID=2992803 RepID=A0ABT3KM22_9GAMM|nr:SatD family protein [Marinomonas sp. KJ51-3]MCW4631586.1 SatD family protein [Marinomonas sp. KJ51-3]